MARNAGPENPTKSIDETGRNPPRDASEQTGHILIQVAPFILEYYQGVFSASRKKVKERRGGIERVGQDQIEGARIRTDHPLQ